MTGGMTFEQARDLVTATLKNQDIDHRHCETSELIYQLAIQPSWEGGDLEILDQLARRIDISGKLHCKYGVKGKVIKDELVLQEPWYSILALQLYRDCLLKVGKDGGSGLILKRYNTLLKTLDLANQPWLDESTGLRKEIDKSLSDAVDNFRYGANITPCQVTARSYEANEPVLPLTILFYEGPIARAYLETIAALGFKPRKIIQLVAEKDIASKKPVGRLLPGQLRVSYAANIQKGKIHYWPKKIAQVHPELQRSIASEIEEKLQFSHDLVTQAQSLKPLESYCHDVDSLLVNGLSDDRLEAYLGELPGQALLYTGGGIVPRKLLDIDKHRLVHVHPGYLPDIRGADCVLWSTLMTGHPSATSFYMAPGIDAGDIIAACWLPQLKFRTGLKEYDSKTLYRALYAFCDPWVRAYVLRETLNKYNDLYDVAAMQQDESCGTTFHFMHQGMLSAALDRAFVT